MPFSAQPSPASPILKAGGVSSERQIFSILQEEIFSGRWAVGSAMPSLRELAKRFGVSRVPVHRAIIKLEEIQMVRRVHGSGVHVLRTEPREDERVLPLVETTDFLERPDVTARGEPGDAKHFVSSAERTMLWNLVQSRAVRLRRIPVVDLKDMREVLENLIPSGVEVFVFATPERLPAPHVTILRDFVKSGGSVIYRATWMDIPEFDAVKLDFESGQYQLTRHLFEKGHRRLVRARVPNEALFELDKQKGFERACREEGWKSEDIRAAELPAPIGSANRAEELQHAIAWLQTSALPLQPGAIMAVNDPEAAIIRLALAMLDRKDIEVAGYDAVWKEVDWSKFLSGLPPERVHEVEMMLPPASVDAGHWEMGGALATLALERATQKLPSGPQLRILPQKLVLPEPA